MLRARFHLYLTRILEDLEVLGNLGLPELQPVTDVVHRPRVRAKQVDDSKSIGFT